jgi:uncharacterized membrane protein YesL
MKFFNLDGPFQKYGSLVFDLLVVSFLWFTTVIITLGIGTGAATTAVFYVMDKYITREKGYLISSYFSSFKSNFLQGTIIWIIVLVANSIIYFNLFILDHKNIPQNMIFVTINYVLLYQFLSITIYIFPLLSKIRYNKTKDYFFNSFKLANHHIFSSIGCIIITGIVGVALYIWPTFILLIIGIYVLLISKIVMGHVIKGYYKEELEV